jgi:hypothetical protein
MTPTPEAMAEVILRLMELILESRMSVSGRCVDLCPVCGDAAYALERTHGRTVQWVRCPTCSRRRREER